MRVDLGCEVGLIWDVRVDLGCGAGLDRESLMIFLPVHVNMTVTLMVIFLDHR